MSVVVTFERFRPPARFDSLPWTEVRIEEATEEDGDYTQIEVQALSPVDPDPTDPALRSFTTELGTDDALWYRIIFADASGDTATPTVPQQNAPVEGVTVDEAYATASELATILQVNETSNAAALDRVLLAAAGEIVTETGRSDFAGWELELVAQVNLARAEELWKQMKAPWGVVAVGGPEFGTTLIARDTFARHAQTLAPLKAVWGIA